MIARPDGFSDEGDQEKGVPSPTPKEIRKRAKAIRKKWSPRTRTRRRVSGAPKWNVPRIQLDLPEESPE